MTSILIVTDTWLPQINGVVRTLQHTIACLEEAGISVKLIEPSRFRTLPCPTYPEIRLSLTTRRRVAALMADLGCEHVHIATEGPLGMCAAAAMRARGQRYSTSYHTRFPEYLAARAPIPLGLSYAWLRRFHNRASACMVATKGMKDALEARGFSNLHLWPRGVDTSLFAPNPDPVDPYAHLERPIWLSVGRVSVEKSLPSFLDLALPGSKVVIGDGPALKTLRAQYPDVAFLGAKTGADLAAHYRAADVFVFPSRTDTFGLVMLEALASGVPVATFPVTGPIDVIQDGETGILSENLAEAAMAALNLSRARCRQFALTRSWQSCTDVFMEILSKSEGFEPPKVLRA
ncbi:MAG: glycosyltransferase family 1 protein [Pseudomonadota bacterium]